MNSNFNKNVIWVCLIIIFLFQTVFATDKYIYIAPASNDTALPAELHIGSNATGLYKLRAPLNTNITCLNLTNDPTFQFITGSGYCEISEIIPEDGCNFAIRLNAPYSTGNANSTIDAAVSSSRIFGVGYGVVTNITNSAAPAITNITPGYGFTGNTTGNITISGANFFTGAGKIKLKKIGSADIDISNASISNNSNITGDVFLANTTTLGGWDVMVTNNDSQTFTLPNAFKVRAPLAIYSINPTSGLANQSMTIRGSGFTGFSAVNFNDNAVASNNVTFISDAQIDLIIPNKGVSDADDVNVTVTVDEGASNNASFTYLNVTPYISSISPNNGNHEGGTSITITGSNLNGANPVVGFTVNGTTENGSIVNQTANYIIVNSPVCNTGSASASVYVRTNGKTSNNLSYFYIEDAPALYEVTPNFGPTGQATIVTMRGANFHEIYDNTSIGKVLFGAVSGTIDAANASNATMNVTVPYNDGITTVTPGAAAITFVTDENITIPTSQFFTYYNQPTVQSLSPNVGVIDSDDTGVVISGFDFTGATAVNFGNNLITNFTINSDSQITVTAPNVSVTGPQQVTVTSPGGTSTNLANFLYSNKPFITSLNPNSGRNNQSTNFDILGTGFVLDNVNATVSFNDAIIVPNSINDTNINVTAPSILGFTGPVNVTVSTLLGAATSTFTYTSAPPVISNINPNAGALNTNTTNVIINGSNFATPCGSSNVTFGVAGAANIISCNNTSINVTAPSYYVAGPVNVTVKANNETSAPVIFNYYDAPTVTSVTPNIGPDEGNISVTINGSNFFNTTNVQFISNIYSLNASNISIVNAQQIVVTAPDPHLEANSVANVVVTTPYGISAKTNSNLFSYLEEDAPVISSMSPNGGPINNSATVVSINGLGFLVDEGLGNVSVKFGSANATIINQSATRLNVTVPSSNTTGVVNVTVTSNDGAISAPRIYTYYAQPRITDTINPNSGTRNGGTVVVIPGVNFLGATEVKFGNKTASFTVNNNTRITTTSPSGSIGNVNVTVTTPGGASNITENAKFEYK